MLVIDLETTKTLLGITGAGSDNLIETYIPMADSVTRQIIGGDYETILVGRMASGSPDVEISAIEANNRIKKSNSFPGTVNRSYQWKESSGIRNPYIVDDTASYFMAGQRIEGPGIPDLSYIKSVNRYTNQVTMSANATASSESEIEIGFPIGLNQIVAKLIYWFIDGTSTSTDLSSVQSKSIGPVSVAFGDRNSQIDGRFGVPSWYVKAISNSLRKQRGF
jgi:hypothetical protein